MLRLLVLYVLFISQAAAQRSSNHHPPKAWGENNGLPDSCLTYEERYARSKEPSSTPASQGHHNFAIISWGLWHGQNLLPDLVASLRALAQEGHNAGYDVWFMYRVDTGDRVTLAEYKQVFPADLRDFVEVWDAEEVFALYDTIPDLPLFGTKAADRQTTTFTVMGLGYVPGTWFMHRFVAYDFAFMVETDVRYTGDWGRFLNAALNLAIAAKAPDWPSLADHVWGPTVKADTAATTALPTSLEGLPDLLNFLPIWRSDKWTHTRKNVSEPTYDSMLMLWGGSRKLFDAMHTWSRQGKAIFYEAFMPTVAVSQSLKMQSIEHPVWLGNGSETWHCCFDGARAVYENWKRSGRCLHASLLHPVKLREPYWQDSNSNSSKADEEVKPALQMYSG